MAQPLVRLNLTIPSHSPIPNGTIALIGGITADLPIFGLYNKGKEIYIHTTSSAVRAEKEEIDPEDPFYDFKTIQKNRKLFERYLEEIVRSCNS